MGLNLRGLQEAGMHRGLMRRGLIAALLLGIVLGGGFSTTTRAQTLSQQVLQLLTRTNTWTAKNTFLDLRLAIGVPSDTTNRFYTDAPGNLYYNGSLVAGVGGVLTPHNILSVSHADTVAAAVTRGGLIIGNSTPAWVRLGIGGVGTVLRSDGTDVNWSTNGSALTNLSAANLVGALPAIAGDSLTALDASALSKGTVPLARVSGITFAQWASSTCVAGQAPVYNGAAWACVTLGAGTGTVTSVALAAPGIFTVAGSPVTTAGTLTLGLATETANTLWAGPTSGGAATPTFRALVNADFPLTGVAAGSYPKVTVNTAGLVTAAATQITLTTDVTGALPMANGGTGVVVAADDTLLVGSGAAWAAQTLPNCPSPYALGYTQGTNLFNCVTTGGPPHALLSATHSDTLPAAVTRGALILGNASPVWSRLAIGPAGSVLWTDGTDALWTPTPRLAATLFGALGASTNGTLAYCSDCTIASPCAGAGTGALAKRLNGIWVCN